MRSFSTIKDEFEENRLPAVDGEAGSGDLSRPLRPDGTQTYPLIYMENVCGGTLNDKGVEVDWMRVFWDVHTNGTSPPSFTAMMDWMNDAFALELSPPYDELDYEAGVVGGTLETNWDSAKVNNGIDH